MPVHLRIPRTGHSPELAFRVNPTYALYHWLRVGGRRPPTDERLRPAFGLMRKSTNPPGIRGVAESWEAALALGDTADQSLHAFQAGVKATGDDMVMAMRIAERIFMEEHWPRRERRIRQVLDVLQRDFLPAFPAMAREHADLLDLRWPRTVDVHLVADCDQRGGAYSRPLTIDVTQVTGTLLFETILHEATHIADVHGHETGHPSLGDRLQAFLGERGVAPGPRFNAWHAVIFAASAACTRHHFGADHVDYASSHQLYAFYGVPHIADAWRHYADQGRDEARLCQALLDDLKLGQTHGRQAL